MFATLLGGLPQPPLADDASPIDRLRAVVQAQTAAGLEPVTDAGFGIGATAVERWQAAAALTDHLVKATVVGPLSSPRAPERELATLDGALAAALVAADAANAELRALVAAGCRWLEIHEPAATRITADDESRSLFREAHRRLLDGVSGVHVTLAITGGSADRAGIETLLSTPYSSIALDLIAGPDNWRLVVGTPGQCGVICGALSAMPDSDDRPEPLVWAAGYAASTGGRGPDRVGLATASSLAGLPWDVAVRKLQVLGESARIAALPTGVRRERLDPRAVDSRSAALGRVMPPERHRRT